MRGSVASATASAVARGRIDADAVSDEEIQLLPMFQRVEILSRIKVLGQGSLLSHVGAHREALQTAKMM